MATPLYRRVRYTLKEKELLLSLVKPKLRLVESKKCDASSIQKKKDTWDLIALEYNATPDITHTATAKQLRKFWQNMKARAKDEIELKKNGVHMTGHRQLPSEADEISQQVYGIIQEQLESMPNELDGDNEIMQIAVTPLQVSGSSRRDDGIDAHLNNANQDEKRQRQISPDFPDLAYSEDQPSTSSIREALPSLRHSPVSHQHSGRKRKWQLEDLLNDVIATNVIEGHAAKMKKFEASLRFLEVEHKAKMTEHEAKMAEHKIKMAIYEKQLAVLEKHLEENIE